MSEVNPEQLIEGFSDKLRSDWRQHRKQIYNENTKGASYENAFRDFLDEYFGGVYDIRTRTAVIDDGFNCFDVFTGSDSELDIVASFKQSYPALVLESGEMRWVPYRGVAFICEVKSKITKPSLENDLVKMEKLNALDTSVYSNRFGQRRSGIHMYPTSEDGKRNNAINIEVEHQLKCLVYDENEIAFDSLITLLEDDYDRWDLLLLVEDDTLLINPNLPFTDGWYNRYPEELREALPDIVALPDGLVWFVTLIAASIPQPTSIYTGGCIMQLVQREYSEEPSHYDGLADAWTNLQ